MKRAAITIGFVLLAFVGGALVGWGKRPPAQTIYRDRPVAYVPKDSLPEAETQPLQECPSIAEVIPTPKARAALEAKAAPVAIPPRLLSLKDVGPLLNGGQILVGLPEIDEDRGPDSVPVPVEVVVIPKPAKFFQLDLSREVGVTYGFGPDGETWGADLQQNIARVGPVRIGAHVGAIGDRWLVGVRASARF